MCATSVLNYASPGDIRTFDRTGAVCYSYVPLSDTSTGDVLGGGAIAGIVIAILIALLLILLLILVLLRRRRRHEGAKLADVEGAMAENRQSTGDDV